MLKRVAIIAIAVIGCSTLASPVGAGAATPLPNWTNSPGARTAQTLCTKAVEALNKGESCRPPDFSTTSWSVVVVVGAQFEEITTRGGVEYASAGPAAGLAVSPVSPTLSYGWLWPPVVGANPSESQIEHFVSGWGSYVSDNIGVGLTALNSPSADGDRGTYSRIGVAVTIGPSSGVEVGVGFSVKRTACTITASTIDCPPAPPIHIAMAKPVHLKPTFPKAAAATGGMLGGVPENMHHNITQAQAHKQWLADVAIVNAVRNRFASIQITAFNKFNQLLNTQQWPSALTTHFIQEQDVNYPNDIYGVITTDTVYEDALSDSVNRAPPKSVSPESYSPAQIATDAKHILAAATVVEDYLNSNNHQ